MKVSGSNRPKGILKGTSKFGGFHKEIYLNPSSGRSETRMFKIYPDMGWSNEGNFWYILGPLNLLEWNKDNEM